MLTDSDDHLFDADPQLGWDPADDTESSVAADQRSSVASTAPPPSEPDWQLDITLNKYTHIELLDSSPALDDPAFCWPIEPDKQQHVFDSIPFPTSEPLIVDDHGVVDPAQYSPMQMSPTVPFQPYPRPAFPTHYPVFPSTDDTAVLDPRSPDDFGLYTSPWASPIIPDCGGSPQPPNRVIAAPQAIRPLVLAHRTSLPSSLPTTPYRQQHFFHNSAPDTFSPIRQYSRRYTTSAEDAAARKRKRSVGTPELPDKDKPPQRSELHPPKQAPSTWQVFFADWLEEHRARNPRQKLNVAQAAKEAGTVYHNLRPDERERLKQRAQAAKEDRDREVAEWKKKLTPDDIKRENAFRAAQRKAGKSRKGNLKDPNAPKKPLSAYFMFLQKIRSSPQLVLDVFGDETETTKQSVLAAAKWRSLSDDEKKPFLLQAEQEKIEYEAARRVYEDRAGTTTYRSTGEMGQNGSSTSVLAYAPIFTMDPLATDDEGEASEGFSDQPEEAQ